MVVVDGLEVGDVHFDFFGYAIAHAKAKRVAAQVEIHVGIVGLCLVKHSFLITCADIELVVDVVFNATSDLVGVACDFVFRPLPCAEV